MHIVTVKEDYFLLVMNKEAEVLVYNLNELIKFWNYTEKAEYDIELDFHYKNF